MGLFDETKKLCIAVIILMLAASLVGCWKVPLDVKKVTYVEYSGDRKFSIDTKRYN